MKALIIGKNIMFKQIVKKVFKENDSLSFEENIEMALENENLLQYDFIGACIDYKNRGGDIGDEGDLLDLFSYVKEMNKESLFFIVSNKYSAKLEKKILKYEKAEYTSRLDISDVVEMRLKKLLEYHKNRVLVVKDIVFDLDNNTVNKGGKNLELTKNQMVILQIFMENPNKIVPREYIIDKIWDCDIEKTNTLNVEMCRLRKKLGEGKTYFVNVKGIGYKFYENQKVV